MMNTADKLQASEVLKKLIIHVSKIEEAKARYYAIRKMARVMTLDEALNLSTPDFNFGL